MMLTMKDVGLTTLKSLSGPTTPPWTGKPVECCSGIGSFHVEIEPYPGNYNCVLLVCTACGEGWWMGFTTTSSSDDPPRRGGSSQNTEVDGTDA